AGTLDRARLELAAYCGSEVARHVLGGHVPPEPPDWARGLERFGLDAIKAFGAFFEAASEPLVQVGPDASPWEDPLQAVAFETAQRACLARRTADVSARELEELRRTGAHRKRLAQAEQQARDAARAARTAEAAAEQARR